MNRKKEKKKKRYYLLSLDYYNNFAGGHCGSNIMHLLQFQGMKRWPGIRRYANCGGG